MNYKAALFSLLSIILSVVALAQSNAQFDIRYQISEIQSITPNVDRLKNQTGNVFATVFCNAETAQVMIVDNGPLDGKQFLFPSASACAEARMNAKKYLKSCKIELGLQTKLNGAQILFSDCQK